MKKSDKREVWRNRAWQSVLSMWLSLVGVVTSALLTLVTNAAYVGVVAFGLSELFCAGCVVYCMRQHGKV